MILVKDSLVYGIQKIYSLFQTFAAFWMSYAFFWLIPRRGINQKKAYNKKYIVLCNTVTLNLNTEILTQTYLIHITSTSHLPHYNL
jgi:succinate-acetate transporter protein